MSLKELNEKREKLFADARAALDEVKANTDASRAKELEDRHDAILVEFDAVEATIEREQRMADIEARFEERKRAERRPNAGAELDARGQADVEKPEYREVFYKFLSTGASLDELSGEERDVLRAGVVPGKDEKRTQVTSTGGAGGYTVPRELANVLIKSMKAWGPMYDGDIASEIVTSGGNQIDIPTVDDTGKTGAGHTEGSDIADDGSQDVTFGQKNLNAYAFDTEFVKWSFELAQDSIFNMEALLGELLGERLGRIANAQLTTGSGTNAPNGIVTASTLGKTTAAVAALTTDDLIDLVHSVDPAYRQSPKVRFMFNDLTLAAIRKLKDGDGKYIWSVGDIQNGVPGTILGYRYSINQAMDGLAAAKKVAIFGDLGKYYVRKVGSPAIGVLRERFWPNLGIAGLIRFDGELGDTAAVKHLITAAS